MRFPFPMILLAVLLGGCATSGPTGSIVLKSGIAPEKARLVIYRTSPLGFAVQPSYMVDGKPIAGSQPNGFIVCNLEPGRHKISVNNVKLNVNFGGGTDKVTVNMAGGRTTYFKAEPQLGLTVGVITLSEVTENQGRTDTASLHKISGNCT